MAALFTILAVVTAVDVIALVWGRDTTDGNDWNNHRAL